MTLPVTSDDAVFRRALAFTLKYEGGYVNHPDDPGGMTNKGVTQIVYNTYRRTRGAVLRSVRLIGNDEVEDIYRRSYWERTGCPHLPPMIAIAAFDFAVNSGVSRSVRYLQQITGSAVDGITGPRTIGAVWSAVNNQTEAIVVSDFIEKRRRFLQELRTFRVFGKGWMRRVDALRVEVGV
jgi:lysozyme family protein